MAPTTVWTCCAGSNNSIIALAVAGAGGAMPGIHERLPAAALIRSLLQRCSRVISTWIVRSSCSRRCANHVAHHPKRRAAGEGWQQQYPRVLSCFVQLDPQDHTKIDQIDGLNLGVGHIAQGLPDVILADWLLV